MTSSTDRKYIAYRNSSTGRSNDDHRQHTHNIWRSSDKWCIPEICSRKDRQTDRVTAILRCFKLKFHGSSFLVASS